MFTIPTARPLLAAVVSLILGVTGSAQEVLKIEDGGAVKSFVLAEDEVVLQGDTTNGERLRDDIEAALPGATVLEMRHGEALTRLPQRVDRRQAAARQAPMQNAAPQYLSNPVLYADGLPRTLGNRRYISPRVVVEIGQGKTLDQLRAETGAAQAENAPLPGHALLTFPDGWQSLAASERLGAAGLKARPLLRRYAERMWAPRDPFLTDQWHVKNRGQAGGLVGADANLPQAWDMARGAGVTVVVVDDSLETTHPDLQPNTPPVSANVHADFRSTNPLDTDPGPVAFDDAHGTSVAGVIAAAADNTNPATSQFEGGAGAAPSAQLLGVRLIGGFFDAQTAYTALTWQPAGFTSSVSNNSWGWGGVAMHALDPIERQALQDAATTRRGGLGQVTLFAAANNDQYFNGSNYTSQDANYQAYANSRFVIGVGACTNYGDHSYYSNRGASVLICAPSNGGSLGIFTTDNVGSSGYNSRLDPGGQPGNNSYTNSFGGTSSATPLTSGIVALILSKNPGLGYRDVMEILATTARKIDPANPDWVTNGAGYDFAHAYGAGMVNAAAAVARSLPWKNLDTPSTHTRVVTGLPAAVVDAGATLTRTMDFGSSANLKVEHVEVVIAATHPNRSDLEIAITSPSGTRSILNPIRNRPNLNYTGDDDRDIGSPGNGWVFMTTHHWGENSSGTWTLTARDGRSGSAGSLESVQVRVHGTPAPLQRVRFAQRAVTVQEDVGTVNLAVDRLGPTNTAVQVNYAIINGSATGGGEDYTLVNGVVNFAPGEVQKNIAVQITDDDIPEATENVFIVLTNPVGATLGGGSLCTLSIAANDGNFVTITPLDSDAAEVAGFNPKNEAEFLVTRVIVDDNPLTVNFTVSGSATMGVDYNAIPNSVTIQPGFDSAKIKITPIDDATFEGTETVKISLIAGEEFALGAPDEAEVNLLDNEIPDVNVISSTTSLPETGATTGTLKVTRTGATTTDLVVDLFIGGSAQPGIDYVALPTSVIIPSGLAEKTFVLQPNDNAVYNLARTVYVRVEARPDYTQGFNKFVEIRLLNDEPTPDVKIPAVTIATPKANEKISAGVTTLSATGGAKDNIKVDSVQFRVNGGDWQTATLPTPTTWSADLLAHSRPGPNLLEARAKDEDGNFSPIVSRPYAIVQPRLLTISVVGPGTVTPPSGQFEAGQTYTLIAKPAAGKIFAGWTGDLTGSSKSLMFTMPDAPTSVTATFMENPFADAVIGRYTGLVSGTQTLPSLSGLLDITISKMGTFTGRLWYDGAGLPFKGEFSGEGKFAGSVKRSKRLPLAVALTLDMNPQGTLSITGTVDAQGNPEISTVLAKRAGYDAKLRPLNAEFARAYTFYLPPKTPADVSKPQGYGVGTLSITTGGLVKWTGTLPDGTPASQSAVLDSQNTWPFYVPLYKGTGYISGQVTHDPAATDSDLAASLDWAKAPAPKDRYFPDGFTIDETSLIGVNYTAPAKGTRVLPGYDTAPANSGPLSLAAGNLTQALTGTLKLLTTNKTESQAPGADKLRISIATKTGAVSGSFVFPITKKATPIRGVILQNKIGKGVGVFPGSTLTSPKLQTGRLDFAPQPPPP